MPHKLLLADDSVTIQRVIELTFADEDVRVIAVGDGKQAIERIQSERPDIVLADIGMPERDGYEVAAFVKGHPEFAHVPVLLLTGAFEPVDEARARAAGCDGVLVKPFEPQMVINRVKDLLAGRLPAGLWAASPTAQPSKPPSPGDLPVPAAPQEEKAGGGSLDDYFDRLDAAFADLDSATPAAGTDVRPGAQAPASREHPSPAHDAHVGLGKGDALPRWDADLSSDRPRLTPAANAPVPQAPAHLPNTPAVAPAVAPPAVAPPAAAAPAGPEPYATSSPPHGTSLADAFAALLAAERGQSIAPASIRPEDIPDDTIEDIVRRVIDRMGTDSMRHAVIDVAERMVREEIARIKGAT